MSTIHPELPVPGTSDLIEHILAGYAYHPNVMPVDTHMPDAGALVRAIDLSPPESHGLDYFERRDGYCGFVCAGAPGAVAGSVVSPAR